MKNLEKQQMFILNILYFVVIMLVHMKWKIIILIKK